MIRKVSLASLAILAAACSGGGSNISGDVSDMPPIGDIPPPGQANAAPIVSTHHVRAQTGENFVASVAVVDADGDAVTVSLVDGPDWISLAPDGQLTGNPSTDDIGTFAIILDASDGIDTTRATIELTLFIDPIEQAFMTGDFTYITEHSDTALETIVLDEIEAVRARNRQAIIDIYELNADGTENPNSVTGLDWGPPSTSAHFSTRYPYSFPLIISNQRGGGTGENMAIIGEIGAARYALFANNPASMGDYNAEQPNSRLFKNTIDWMVQTDTSESFDVVLAQMPGTFSHDRTVELLDAAFPDKVSANDFAACDSNRFADCMTDELDLIIVFQNIGSAADQEAVIEQMRLAMDRGVAVLFVRRYFNDDNAAFAGRVHALLQSGGSDLFYPYYIGIHGGGGLDVLGEGEPEYIAPLEVLLRGLRDETLDYDLTVCVDDVDCFENRAYHDEVYALLTAVKSTLNTLSAQVGDPFERYDNNRFAAALTLTGDYYRDITRFPMPKASTPSFEIIRALFGEHATVANRKTVPVMPDMGTFSRSEFDNVELGDARITLSGGSPYQTSGLYALPGEPFTVTRHDTTDAKVVIQVNSLSAASGAPFRTVDGSEYVRPVSVNSGAQTLARTITVTGNDVSAELNATIEMTALHGGPIHVYFNSPEEEIDLSFTNVAKHPVWRGPEDNETFIIDLVADKFDWAEFITPRFELHSKVEQMQETLDIARYSNLATLADDMANYFSNWPIWFDGRSGSAIRESDDLTAYLDMLEITPQSAYETVKHATIELAGCAPDCSAQAYEFPSRFDPLDPDHQAASTDALARTGGLRFTDILDETMTDLLRMHSQFREVQSSGVALTECQALPHADFYAHIQANFARGTRSQFVPDETWTAADREKVYFIQLMAALEAQGALESGWDLWPRVTTIARLYNQSSNGLAWHGEPGRKLGFIDVSARSASFLPSQGRFNAFVSWAAQRDLRPFREAYGYSAPGSSSNEVLENQNLPPLEPAFYAIPETGHCASLTHAELPIDGVSTWP